MLTPCATNPCTHSGALINTLLAATCESNSPNTQAPVPVKRDGAYSNSHESRYSTSRKRFLAIISQSFSNGAFNNAPRERIGELRFNSGSVKIVGVGMEIPGCATKYHCSFGFAGVKISPTPSANAA